MAPTVPKLSGPGIILSASHILKPDLLSDDLFNKWYNEAHVQDVIATGGVPRATRFRDANPEAKNQYICIYEVPDLAVTTTEEFKKIPMMHEMLPNGASIHDLASFDTRFYELVQTDENSSKQDGISPEYFPSIVFAGVEPAAGGFEDFDAYMRQEHLEQMSREPGWQRSRRYKLVHSANAAQDPTNYLTLYEFGEGNKLGKEVQACVPMTDWTKRTVEKAQKMELGVYHKIRSFTLRG